MSAPSLKSRDSNGVIILAFGKDYGVMGVGLLYSLRSYNPTLKIHVLTNQFWVHSSITEHSDTFTSSELVKDDTKRNRIYKTSLHLFSPFDKTVYIDADALCFGPIEEIFSISHNFDFGGCYLESPPSLDFPDEKLGTEKLFWVNPRMLLWDNIEGFDIFERWSFEYRKRPGRRDMLSLCKVLTSDPVKLRFFQISRYWSSDYSPKSHAVVQHYRFFAFHYKVILIIMDGLRKYCHKEIKSGCLKKEFNQLIFLKRIHRVSLFTLGPIANRFKIVRRLLKALRNTGSRSAAGLVRNVTHKKSY